MLVKKDWKSKRLIGEVFKRPAYFYRGYFLFGLLPLYISRKTNS